MTPLKKSIMSTFWNDTIKLFTIFVVFACCLFMQSCTWTTPEKVRKYIASENQKIIDNGYNIELNLYDCVSDDFLISAIEQYKGILMGNPFSRPASILSASIDTIFARYISKQIFTPQNKFFRETR